MFAVFFLILELGFHYGCLFPSFFTRSFGFEFGNVDVKVEYFSLCVCFFLCLFFPLLRKRGGRKRKGEKKYKGRRNRTFRPFAQCGYNQCFKKKNYKEKEKRNKHKKKLEKDRGIQSSLSFSFFFDAILGV